MAGLRPIWESMKQKSWPRCSDGSLLEPLDMLFLLFSNKGFVSKRDSNGTVYNACYPAERLRYSPLNNLFASFSSSMYFTPEDFADGVIGLLITSVVVILAIVLGRSIWLCFDPKFKSVTPSHKQWYVVANLCKSFFLGCMALSPRYWKLVYQSYYLDNMDAIYVKRCAILYVGTDLVALFMVPKLPRSTIFHHIVTTVLIVTVCALNMEIKGYFGITGVGKMLILYGIFSTIPYLVNAYLALRVVYSKAKWLDIVVKLSLWAYILCCALNWSIHLIWLGTLIMNMELSIASVVYIAAISMMVNDDIVLIKWLMKKSSPVLEPENIKVS